MVKVKDDKKEKAIFRAALVLHEKFGLSGLKMSAIAKEANVASGTLYIYFDSKEELLNELYKKLKTESFERLESNTDTISPKLALKNIWKSSLRYRVECRKEVRFMVEFQNSSLIAPENKSIRDQYIGNIRRILEDGREERLIKDIPSDVLISTIVGLINEFAILYGTYPFIGEEHLEVSFKICWDAIKK